MYYISKADDSNFGFKVDNIHEILETDVEVSTEIYNRYFEEQAQGKRLKIKDINGNFFEDIFEEIEPKPPTKDIQIIALKSELAETDYKIIKCYEYNLAGLELPYDIQELHNERQNLRDEVNKLNG